MTIKKAKQIALNNGIQWNNYFDLSYVLNNINQKEFPKITKAIKILLDLLRKDKR